MRGRRTARPGRGGFGTAGAERHRVLPAQVQGSGVDATLTTKDRGVDRRLYTGSYFVYQAPPGPLGVSVSSSFNQYIDASFEVAAGKTYYVELDVGALDLALRMLDEAEGVSLLKSLKSTPTPR
jgi:hypothetical protein